MQQFNEPAGGQVVFHLHMHVMPRHDGVALLPPASRKEDVKVLEDNATKLVAALGYSTRHFVRRSAGVARMRRAARRSDSFEHRLSPRPSALRNDRCDHPRKGDG